MTFKFAHFNFNITDLARSLKFYKEALGKAPPAGRRRQLYDSLFERRK